jgi:hypothetical protein
LKVGDLRQYKVLDLVIPREGVERIGWVEKRPLRRKKVSDPERGS